MLMKKNKLNSSTTNKTTAAANEKPVRSAADSMHVFRNDYVHDDFVIRADYKGIVRFDNNKTGEPVPNYLNKIAEDSFSPVHQQMLRLKENMIMGNGIKPNLENPIVAERLAEFEIILNNIDGRGTNINDQYRKYAKNVAVHEAVVFLIGWSDKNRPRFIHYKPTAEYRAEEMKDEIFPEIKNYYICKNWAKGSRNQIYKYPKFNPSQRPDDGYAVLVEKYDSLSNDYYNTPTYHSALKSINTENELQIYYLNTLTNGFHPGGMLSMVQSTQDAETADANDLLFQKKLKGVKNAGNWILNMVASQAERPIFDAINNSADHNTYNEINSQSKQDIITAHGGHAELAGIDSVGVDLGGDANKLLTSWMEYKQTITDHLQDLIIDGYNKIFKAMGFGENAIYCEDKKWIEAATNADGVTDALNDDTFPQGSTVDRAVTSLSGREDQRLERIIRKYDSGKMSEKRAIYWLLKYGMSEEDARSYLMIDEESDKEI